MLSTNRSTAHDDCPQTISDWLIPPQHIHVSAYHQGGGRKCRRPARKVAVTVIDSIRVILIALPKHITPLVW